MDFGKLEDQMEEHQSELPPTDSGEFSSLNHLLALGIVYIIILGAILALAS